MIKLSLEKPFVYSLIGITLAVVISAIANNLTYAYVEYDVSGSDVSQDSFVTNSQSSSQGSYCYAPPGAAIINSCNSGDLSSSSNSGYNTYGQ
jgi:hypothetical protein